MKISAVLLCAVALGCATNSSTKKPANAEHDAWDRTNEVTRPSDPSLDPTAHEPTNEPPQAAPPTTPGAPAPTSLRTHTRSRDRTAARDTRVAHEAPNASVDRAQTVAREAPASAHNEDRDGNRAKATESAALTPLDQGNSEEDLRITQEIRRAAIGDDALSFTAKNVKIITIDGKVTLRGPVDTESERKSLEAAARRVAGAKHVDNQLEVKR